MTRARTSSFTAQRTARIVARVCAVFLCAGGLIWPLADARADAQAGKTKAQTCVACHGPMGNSVDPQYPALAGQSPRYMFLQLKDFKEGRRKDPRMSPMAAKLSKDDMQNLADYFAAQKPVPVDFKADGVAVEAGRKKSAVEVCTMCHRDDFAGQNEIPRVAGQHYQYIVKQLQDFRSRTRTNDGGNMGSAARNLTDDDIRNLASYVANLQ
ncbi:putative cytochrome c, associated with quino(hemo)protein alcohol dehydrogenase (plasmid) [Paraburkholderia caribensis MBA4]|uniref:Putative cytochrome c, associated with quino(Hemo)protein alcohol dehydrogenase n=1 Tax=Paraburkholderia caribensis MBA4 TaxID=1323664 RepID=A0A0P0RNL2_9BURK|nr:c-type cytochrome [Paraburkholderia caribensis]ALL70508.1 putative cytochrome c, associated with quino(hemo)protein alcohol dehydrogenase [Paraburkholderia caribensis MBA4]